MKFRSDLVSHLAAMSLLFSLLDMLLPRPLPFFKVGFSNIVLLISLGTLSWREYFALSILKGILSSYIAGTILSPFLLLSISSSISSAVIMYVLFKGLKDRMSRYGISMWGAFSSTLAQTALASLYIGKGIFQILSPFIIFSTLSSLVVAYCSYKFEIPVCIPQCENEKGRKANFPDLLFPLPALFSITLAKENFVLLLFLFTSLLFLKLERRKILPGAYITLFLASLFSALVIPRGEVLFHIIGFPITRISLSIGLENALTLSSTVALSLALSRFMPMPSLFGKTLSRFFAMEDELNESEGNVLERFSKATKGSGVQRKFEVKTLSTKEKALLSLYPILLLISFLAKNFPTALNSMIH